MKLILLDKFCEIIMVNISHNFTNYWFMLLTVHHVAASGGSIVSQVLAASTNSVLVSEINPFGTVYRGLEPFYDPTSLLWHLVYNSKDLSPTLKLK